MKRPTPERAERLRVATAQSVMDHLRAAGAGVPSHLLATGLATALAEMIGRHVNVKHRAATFERCAAIVSAAERRR